MKRWLFCFALLAAAACGERQSQPQQLVVMTMNMRYDNPEDGEQLAVPPRTHRRDAP